MEKPNSNSKQTLNSGSKPGSPAAPAPSARKPAQGTAPESTPAAGIGLRSIVLLGILVIILAGVTATVVFRKPDAPKPKAGSPVATSGPAAGAGSNAANSQAMSSAAAGQPAGQAAAAGLNAAGDLVIPVAGISSKATFYPATVDGVKLEVLAVKAPDNSIRTAFNTCQVCFDSGRGYYKQEGDTLVCQNCGNRFKISQVEVSKGGCNPVPIFDKEIQMSPTTITIPAAYLKEARDIFENWKAGT